MRIPGLPLLLLLAACGGTPPADTRDAAGGWGAQPELAEPRRGIPGLKFAKVLGWEDGRTPVAPEGFAVTAFASGLDYPRWLLELPNGDVLVSEARTEPREDPTLFQRLAQRLMRASRMVGPSANRVTLLRDTDADGVADVRLTLVEGLRQPFGMAFDGSHLYIAETDAVRRWPFVPGQTTLDGPGDVLMKLPAGGYNNHWTRNLLLTSDGRGLFVSVGSASNIMEHGEAEDASRAAIHLLDLETGEARLYATGLRNPVGMALEPETGALWTAVNERDFLGDDLVPDYVTRVADGGFYGWPWSYFGTHVDRRVRPERPDMVARARVPDFALGAHTASLGLAFARDTLPDGWQQGAFIGQHGSWNRSRFAGYRVVFLPFEGGRPTGEVRDFLTGFIADESRAEVFGRPAGVLVTTGGTVLVADGAGDTVWAVRPTGRHREQAPLEAPSE